MNISSPHPPDMQPARWQREYLEAWGAHLRSKPREPWRASIVSEDGTGKSTLSGLVLWCHLLAWPRSRSIVLSDTWQQSVTRTMRTAIELKDKLLPPLRDLLEVTQTSIRWKDDDYRYSWLVEVVAWSADRLERARVSCRLPQHHRRRGIGAAHHPVRHLQRRHDDRTVQPAGDRQPYYDQRLPVPDHDRSRVGEGWHRRHLSSYDVPWANRAALDTWCAHGADRIPTYPASASSGNTPGPAACRYSRATCWTQPSIASLTPASSHALLRSSLATPPIRVTTWPRSRCGPSIRSAFSKRSPSATFSTWPNGWPCWRRRTTRKRSRIRPGPAATA